MHIGVSAELSEHIEKNFLRPRKAKEKLPPKKLDQNFLGGGHLLTYFLAPKADCADCGSGHYQCGKIQIRLRPPPSSTNAVIIQALNGWADKSRRR